MNGMKIIALENRQRYNYDPVVCAECNKPIPYEQRMNKFCNSSCAAKFNNAQRDASGWHHSNESRAKTSDTMKLKGLRPPIRDLKGKRLAPWVMKICPECGDTFETLASDLKKYCSRECHRLNNGGYREGSGRSKSGYYRGLYCGSTYELAWVIYRLDHKLPVQRFEGCLQEGKLKYFPDFIEGNKIIEIKGIWTECVDQKTALALKLGYEIELKYKEDLRVEFDWVKNHYDYKNMQELYDDYAPIYNYVCECCKQPFTCDKPRKSKSKFCSRTCAGKGHTGRNRLGINGTKKLTMPSYPNW